MEIVEDVSRHVQRLHAAHPRMRYVGGMTTNAYTLSPERLERLLDFGVTRYQISFDGPREFHDRKRVLPGGKGTFDRIWRNVIGMRSVGRDFRVTVRLHVDRDNRNSLPGFIRQYAGAFGRDERFELFIRALACLGGPNDGELPVLGEEEGRDAVHELSELATALGARHVTIEKHAPICYATRGNSYVVRANGRLNKCTVALEHPNNQVGRLSEDGLLDLEPARMASWMRGLWTGDREELECPMHGYADPTDAAPKAPSQVQMSG
jgi:uncharacterized protein